VSDFPGLAPCVHCGFCLQTCPTYVVTGDEADGPRGRIVLMQRLGRGELSADAPVLQHHLDRCLGCRACETVCPSGVRYGSALEDARAQIGVARPHGILARLALTALTSPTIRRPLLALARLLRPGAAALAGWSRPRFALGMLAGSIPWSAATRCRRNGSTNRGRRAPAG
jgi:glycolate oxidase iron-sulfur subunit